VKVKLRSAKKGSAAAKRADSRDEEDAAALASYRQHLILASQKAQSDYDRNVLTLSGGAIGLSLIFLRDIIKQGVSQQRFLVLGAWVAWGASILFVLGSYLLSKLALDTTVQQVDKGTIYQQKPGKAFSTLVSLLNVGSGLLFLVGIVLLGVFVYSNF
jgi:hypothetical protein